MAVESETEMPSTDDVELPHDYLGFAVFNLKVVGIMIHNDIDVGFFKYLYFAYSTFLLFTFVYFYTITEIIHIYKNFSNVDELLFTLSYLVAHCIGTAKITLLLIKRKSISNFIHSLEKGRFIPDIQRGGLEEVDVIRKAISRLLVQKNIFWAIVVVMLSNRMIWIIMHPTIEEFHPDKPDNKTVTWQLPYANSYGVQFNLQKSPSYELVFVHQVISTWIFGWYMGNADVITYGLLIHLTAQFQLVANSFTNIVERARRLTTQCTTKHQKRAKVLLPYMIQETDLEYDDIFMKNLKECLKECVKHHQDVYKLCQNMEHVYNLMLLIQFVGCLSLYGIQLYQLSLLSITSTSFLSMSFFMFAMIFQLFAFCWNGNELSTMSESVAAAVYNCKWVPGDQAVKSLLLISMVRAQRPVYITAGKFSKLSLATFATILRGSFSYFMVLRKMNE